MSCGVTGDFFFELPLLCCDHLSSPERLYSTMALVIGYNIDKYDEYSWKCGFSKNVQRIKSFCGAKPPPKLLNNGLPQNRVRWIFSFYGMVSDGL
jgi:hypothetical protein